MGILVKKPILVAQCGHLGNAEAWWTTENDGNHMPDLWFSGFPTTGRVMMSNQIIYLSCRACSNGLDAVVSDHIKPVDGMN